MNNLDTKRELLRHTVATLAYRGGKAVRDSDDSFASFKASETTRTPAQILFRYLTQTGVVPLTGTRSETHMREDLSIVEFELTDAERRSMDEVLTE